MYTGLFLMTLLLQGASLEVEIIIRSGIVTTASMPPFVSNGCLA